MALPLSTDPRDLLLDDSNDIVITTDLQFSRGLPAIVQSCRIALLMFKGEWFLNLDAGVPYLQAILGKKARIAIESARLAYRDELEQIVGVLRITQLDITYDGPHRRMQVNFAVSTIFGDSAPNKLFIPVTQGNA